MPTAATILAMAASQIGVKENPAGSNRVKYTDWYGLVGPWCAMFVSWVADQTDATTIIPRHAYCPDGAAWFQSKGLWSSTPHVGDVVYYAWPGMGRVSHVGFVEAVNSNGTITAIEGNTDERGGRTGGKVMRQNRSAYISGYGRPAYSAADPSGGDDDMATYYCEIAQNTGQEISAAGEDVRMQVENVDKLGWHSSANPSMVPDRKVSGTADATIYVDGAAEVRLRTYSSENDAMRTIAAHTTHGAGYVNVSGSVGLSVGHKLRLWVRPIGSDTTTCRSGVLCLSARDA